MTSVKSTRGMTLIELVIAFAILSVIVIVFLSLFTGSLIWILGAGDKGEALNLSQDDVESRIGREEAIDSLDLELVFDGQSYTINGGLINSNEKIGGKNSQIEAFVPFLPTIQINPSYIYEGFSVSVPITITGIANVHLSSSTVVDVLYEDFSLLEDDIPKAFSDNGTTETDDDSLVCQIPANLTNAEGFYIITVTTLVDGVNEIARAKLTVGQPVYLAVGGGNVASSNGTVDSNDLDWIDRSSLDDFPSFSNLNAVDYGNGKYIAVGENGIILYSQDEDSWQRRTVTSNDWKAITWANQIDQFFITSGNGSIYSSRNGINWTLQNSGTNNSLNGIQYYYKGENDYILIAVGEDGTFLESTNGTTWSNNNQPEPIEIPMPEPEPSPAPEPEPDYIDIKGIAISDTYKVAVGEFGYIFYSDGGTWNSMESEVTDVTGENNIVLNSVAYGNGLFIAVGDAGTILSSSSPNVSDSWTSQSDEDFGDLKGITFKNGMFIAVGDDNIVYSDDGTLWHIVHTAGSYSSVSGSVS